MSSSERSSAGVPLSIQELGKQAGNFEYNDQVPLRYWLRSADTIQKEAQIYEGEGNDVQTYLLLMRHAILVLEKLSQHPEVKDPKTAKALIQARKIVEQNFSLLDQLKPRIEKKHKRYVEYQKRRDEQIQAIQSSRGVKNDTERTGLQNKSFKPGETLDPSIYGSKQALVATENHDLAARLAQREIKRRDGARRSVRQAGVSEEEEQERRVGGLWGDWEQELAGGPKPRDQDDLSSRIQEAGRTMARDTSTVIDSRQAPRGANYHYPTVPYKSDFSRSSHSPAAPTPPSKVPQSPPRQHAYEQIPPQLPPKTFQHISFETSPRPPPVPRKITSNDNFSARPQIPAAESNEINSRDYTFKTTAYLENGTPLRPLFIPTGLRDRFLSIASRNTQSNLETCGVLCGTLISNALFISKLVIPEQKSTSDTCETLNEEALFDYCDEEGLMVLGWIHTHPSQTCFMSSRDLHTHSGYQVMLAESVAIVCAPSKSPSWGVFRLTDPPGLKTILNCSHSGLFHPHDTPNTYTDAVKPGHVIELLGLEFQVKDLRPGFK